MEYVAQIAGLAINPDKEIIIKVSYFGKLEELKSFEATCKFFELEEVMTQHGFTTAFHKYWVHDIDLDKEQLKLVLSLDVIDRYLCMKKYQLIKRADLIKSTTPVRLYIKASNHDDYEKCIACNWEDLPEICSRYYVAHDWDITNIDQSSSLQPGITISTFGLLQDIALNEL